MINITVFGKSESDFMVVDKELEKLRDDFIFQVFQINTMKDPAVHDKYRDKTPVIIIGPYTLNYPFTDMELRVALSAATDRDRQMSLTSDEQYLQRKSQGANLTKTDQFGYWLSRHFMLLFNVFLFLYVALPFLAPVLMKTGLEKQARVIYTIYSPLCHQLAFRSWFLFGEQPFYPRSLANLPDVRTYEEISGGDELNVLSARTFVGNEIIGYKVALCQRDVAIYAAMLAFGLLFSITGNRIRPVRWYVWIVIGLIPIGFDGVSQLPGLMNRIPEWLLMRESTPGLRSITGALFGLTTAWYLFPLIEMSMQETREILFRKISISKNNR